MTGNGDSRKIAENLLVRLYEPKKKKKPPHRGAGKEIYARVSIGKFIPSSFFFFNCLGVKHR
jgi:hypothetical protein